MSNALYLDSPMVSGKKKEDSKIEAVTPATEEEDASKSTQKK